MYSGGKILWQTDAIKKTDKDYTNVIIANFNNEGNLVIYMYDMENIDNFTNIWESKTQGKGEYVILEDDGNLVIYDINGKAVWETNTKHCRSLFCLNYIQTISYKWIT